MSFAGKVVAITGAAGGIGQAMCRHFSAAGAKIGAIDISEKLGDFVAELRAEGATVEGATANIGEEAEVSKAFAAISKALGPVDILVNNAGISHGASLARTDGDVWRQDISVNLSGAWYCASAVLPAMKERRSGAIVNIGSVNGLAGYGDPAYSAGKAGMVSLTRSMAMELGRYGIRVNIVCPGTVRTPIWEHRVARKPEILAELTRWYPLGRVADPIDVAKAVAFLASDDAAAITGIVLPVDCGLTAGNLVMTREITLEDI
jgi:NAD(P)-dependent dehydrogenase (short-subunit alcohol dehydrogenase family)